MTDSDPNSPAEDAEYAREQVAKVSDDAAEHEREIEEGTDLQAKPGA